MKWCKYVAAALMAFALIVCPGLPAQAATAPIWAQQGFGPGDPNFNPYESAINPSTVEHLGLRWKVNATPACGSKIPPIVEGNHLFTVDPHGIGSYTTATGAQRWHTAMHRGVAAMAIDNGLLVVLSSRCTTVSPNASILTTFNPVTGKQVWQRGYAHALNNLTVAGGIIVVDGSDPQGVSWTAAYGITQGALRWRISNVGQLGVSAGGQLLLDDYASSPTMPTLAVSIATGKQLWRSSKSWWSITANPAGTEFYVTGFINSGRSYGLSAVKATTGAVLWTTSRSSQSRVTSDGHNVYYATAKSIVCLDAETGHAKYSVPFSSAPARPVGAGELLYVRRANASTMAVLTAANGKSVANLATGKQTTNPVIVGGHVYVFTTGLNAYAP